jgi:hypothetical protein
MADTPKIQQRNVYGWFVRVERGVYGLTEGGKAALVRWKEHLPLPETQARCWWLAWFIRWSSFAHRIPNRFDHAISIMLRPIAGVIFSLHRGRSDRARNQKFMGTTRP